MFYLTTEECSKFSMNRQWKPDFEKRWELTRSELQVISFMVPPERDRLMSFCNLLFRIIPIGSTEDCLIWGINHMLEGNSQLYYRLRQSYGDFKPLFSAPGHLFLGHEGNDLVTFLHLFLLFGWDFHCLPEYSSSGAYHDDELMVL